MAITSDPRNVDGSSEKAQYLTEDAHDDTDLRSEADLQGAGAAMLESN